MIKFDLISDFIAIILICYERELVWECMAVTKTSSSIFWNWEFFLLRAGLFDLKLIPIIFTSIF